MTPRRHARVCSWEGCDRPPISRGYCGRCARRVGLVGAGAGAEERWAERTVAVRARAAEAARGLVRVAATPRPRVVDPATLAGMSYAIVTATDHPPSARIIALFLAHRTRPSKARIAADVGLSLATVTARWQAAMDLLQAVREAHRA